MPLDGDLPARLEPLRRRARAQRTASWRDRREKLRALRNAVVQRRKGLEDALAADLGRPATETDLIEYLPLVAELDRAIAEVKRWSQPRTAPTPLALFGARSEVMWQPKGVCLILSPWNYPALLVLGPLVSCIAAGNSAVLKPSEFTPATCAYLRELIAAVFDPSEVILVEGGPETATALLAQPFDHIFFTGSPQVGRQVMAAAAKWPSSVTLELGGKSPAIVLKSADIVDTARKLVWSKFVNAGQTCISPDYVLAEAPIAEALKQALIARIRKVYPAELDEGRRGGDYAAIISQRHAARLIDMVEDARKKGARILVGGVGNAPARFLAPTVLDWVTPAMRVVQEEIFGPILPVYTATDLDAAIAHVNAGAPPLASYLFGKDRGAADRFIAEMPAGGSCVNHALIHFGNDALPFGGIGPSGIGRSHGQAGFEAFSNQRSIMRDRFSLTHRFFPPYTRRLKTQMAAFLRLRGAA
jgi:aldehyde dehydrogenase (NAD+)